MHERAAYLIAALGLEPHPEGGYFRRVHYSAAPVQPLDGRPQRVALSSIYFLLVAAAPSRWHRVFSDEAWHHYEGDPVEILMADPQLEQVVCHRLAPVGADAQPVRTVPAGWWQAARSTGEYALVGCSVGPGFEYDDFQLLRHLPADAERLSQRHPPFAELV